MSSKSKPLILVTGANGQLASSIRKISTLHSDFDFLFLSSQEMSITDETQVAATFGKYNPFACVNCAAYTAVDVAETNQQQAYLVNETGTVILARACSATHSRFVHISTDYVFNGNGNTPYKESDAVDPVNIYGASKQSGEEKLLAEYPQAIIIRTSWVYSEFGKNFVKTMLRLMQDKPEIKVVNDQFGSPTYATDLATAIIEILKKPTFIPGMYHYSNKGVISWFDFATAIKNITGSTCVVRGIPTSEYPTPAKRPSYSVLNTQKITDSFSLSIPEWQQSLRICLQQLKAL